MQDLPPTTRHVTTRLTVGPGRHVHVIDQGPADGRPLLLLPALGTDTGIWQAQVPLAAAGYRVVRIDAPGHGQSPDWPATPALSLDGLAATVWQVCDQLGISDCTLAGTSMGAVIALRAAALTPQRVRRLILCGARLQRQDAQAQELGQRLSMAQGDLERVATTMLARWFPQLHDATAFARDADDSRRAALLTFMQQVGQMVRGTSPISYAACATALQRYDLLPELTLLQDKTVLLTGALDEGVPDHFGALQALCPAARLIVLPGIGHFPALEAPTAFWACL